MFKLGENNLALKYTKTITGEVLGGSFYFHKGFETHQVRVFAGVNQWN